MPENFTGELSCHVFPESFPDRVSLRPIAYLLKRIGNIQCMGVNFRKLRRFRGKAISAAICILKLKIVQCLLVLAQLVSRRKRLKSIGSVFDGFLCCSNQACIISSQVENILLQKKAQASARCQRDIRLFMPDCLSNISDRRGCIHRKIPSTH